MKRILVIALWFVVLPTFLQSSIFAENQRKKESKSNSEYVEEEDSQDREEGGGLFNFLPFFGQSKIKVEPEKIEPSPPPQKIEPELQEVELEQLRAAAKRWILTAEFVEPTLRRDEEGRYYRDYIVFVDEYEARVLRGDSDERPFIGHIYIKGDYFKTEPHDTAETARSDFNYSHETREFRLMFDRVEKWEYSFAPDDEPFTFVERWEFRRLQSRPVVNLSDEILPLEWPAKPEDKTPAPGFEGG